MSKRSHIVLTLAALLTSAAGAQTPDWVTALQDAARLPVSANEARKEGVPNNEVRDVVNAMRNKNVRADEARAVLDEARNARREHGPVDNFGAFVQTKLDAGLRGRELAAAIRAEHTKHGKAAKAESAAKSPPGAQSKSAAPASKAKRPPKNRQEDNS